MTQISDQDFNARADEVDRLLREKSGAFASKVQTLGKDVGSSLANADKALQDFLQTLDVDPSE